MKLLLTAIKGNCPETELAVRYLYSVVADAPVESDVRMYESVALDGTIYDDIVRGQYNIVYFHCDENSEYRVARLTEMIKKAMPSSIVVVGGPYPSFETKKYMVEHPYIDYVIRGEGELVLYNFLRTLLSYEFDFENVAGLGYRIDDSIIINPYEVPVTVEELPFPYEKLELTDTERVYYESIRGTADRTCYSQFLPDARIRALPLNRVCTELRYFLVKRVGTVVFLDKWFNYNTERAYRIFEYIINNDNGETSFELNIDGDKLDEETVRLLAEARTGLFTFNIDIGSTNAEVLAAMGRRENVYQLMYNVTKLLQTGKVKVNISIIAGLPMETEVLFARSFNKAYGLGEGASLNIEFLRVRRGTTLKDEASKYGYLYSSTAPNDVIATGFMPATDLIRIKSLAYIVSRYIGDGFKQSIPRIMTDAGLKPYDLFSRLTDYIYSNGLESKMNRPENLYRIMYGFAVGVYDDVNDTLKLQLLMDILHDDMENNLPEETVKRFEKKGWDIEA